MHRKMKSDWESFTKFYAFDEKKYPLEQFFADMKTFKEQYEAVYRELEMEKLKEEKEREDSKKKRPRALPPIKNPARDGLTRLQTAVDSPGVLDELDKMMAVGGLAKLLQGSRTPRATAGRTKTGTSVVVCTGSLVSEECSRKKDSSCRESLHNCLSRAALQRQRSRGADFILREALTGGEPDANKVRAPFSVLPPAPEKVALRPAEISPTHKENSGSPTTDELLARLQQY
ncbi:hypothetical protein COOONC_09287 [Cooperia oncophora]